MSRRRDDGRVGEIAGRLGYVPTAAQTHYQSFCFRLGALILDLPVPEWQRIRPGIRRTIGESDELVVGPVNRWILNVTEINPLAGMVLLDAVENYCDWMCFAAHERDFFIGGTQFKKDFTGIIKDTAIEFQVLPGWEFKVHHRMFGAGARGLAFLVRCHLSASTTHQNYGLRRIAGLGPEVFTDLGYFDVPCVMNRHFGKTTQGFDDEEWDSLTATIAYRWITHWGHYDDRHTNGQMVAAPTDAEIIAIAKGAIEPVEESQDDEPVQLRIAGVSDE